MQKKKKKKNAPSLFFLHVTNVTTQKYELEHESLNASPLRVDTFL